LNMNGTNFITIGYNFLRLSINSIEERNNQGKRRYPYKYLNQLPLCHANSFACVKKTPISSELAMTFSFSSKVHFLYFIAQMYYLKFKISLRTYAGLN
jgi:hypothetical protein